MKNLNNIVAEALVIEAEAAQEAGALTYMARPLTQATMPHSRKEGSTFERRNGAFSMTISAHPCFAVVLRSYPRLVLTWLTTETVRTRCSELELGRPDILRLYGRAWIDSDWRSVGDDSSSTRSDQAPVHRERLVSLRRGRSNHGPRFSNRGEIQPLVRTASSRTGREMEIDGEPWDRSSLTKSSCTRSPSTTGSCGNSSVPPWPSISTAG